MRMGRKGLAAGLIAAGFVFSAPSAFAQQAQERGWYLGGSIGQMEADGSCPGGFSCDLKDTAWKFFGGYRVNRHLAAEAFYGNWGEISLSSGPITSKAEVSSWGLAGLGILPIGNQFSVFGKLGFANSEQEFTVTDGVDSASATDDGSEMIFGFGAGFNFTNNLGLRAEWERLDDSEVDIISIGIQYRF